jgi:protein phosphatase 1 regulatory subunit 7
MSIYQIAGHLSSAASSRGHALIKKELQLLHLRLKSAALPQLNFPRFGQHLKRLCLRQNDLTSPLPAEAFEGLGALDDLDFYDNRLGPSMEDAEIKGCPNLRYASSSSCKS